MFSDTLVAPAGLFGFINPAGLYDPSANGYSHVAVVRLPARVIHVAGQGGETADRTLSSRFEVQVAQALDNLALALASAGAGLAEGMADDRAYTFIGETGHGVLHRTLLVTQQRTDIKQVIRIQGHAAFIRSGTTVDCMRGPRRR